MADEKIISTAPITPAPVAAPHVPEAAPVATVTPHAQTTDTVDVGGALNIGVGTSENISSDSNHSPLKGNANDVVFVVKYGADYKGEKTMPEGEVVISKESAAQFEALKIGKIKK